MKKVLSVLICFAILFGTASNCFAAEAEKSKVSDRAFEEAFEILNSIGVLTEYDDLTLNTEKEVSRAEFADTLAKVLRIASENSDKMYYYDVSKDHFAYKSITALTERGYMSGVGDNMFSPNEVMENNNAVRALANVLGYSYRLIYSDFPENEIIKLAKESGLSDNVTLGGTMTLRDMVVIMRNALVAPSMQMTGISGSDVNYEKDEEKTLLALYYDAHYVEDKRVMSANGVSISGEGEYEGKIQIGDTQYVQPQKDMEDYLGSYVSFIYTGDKDDENKEIIWINKSGINDELTVEITQSGAFDTSSYKLSYYDENDKKKDVVIGRNASVIYNGGFVDNIESVLTLPSYDARIVKDQNKVCDLVVVSDYTDFVVGSMNIDDKSVRNKNGDLSLSLDSADYTYMYLGSGGEEKTIDNMAIGDVISVYKSLDGKRIRMEVSSDKIKGVISGKGVDDGVEYVVIDSVRYKPYKDTNMEKCVTNANVCLYLDAKGKIAYVQNVSESFNSVFVTAVALDNGSLSAKLRIKGFTNEGVFKEFDVANKLTVNGTEYKNGIDKADYNRIKTEIAERISVYKLNSKGELSEINSAGMSDKLKITSPLGSKNYRAISTKLGKMACVDSGTVIFAIPSDITDEDAFSVKNLAALGDWATYNAESYQIDGNDDGFEDIAMIKGYDWFSASITLPLFAVSEIAEGMDEDGDIVKVLKGYQGSSEKIYYCDDSFNINEIKKGDMLRLSLDSKNHVIGVLKKYNKDSAVGESTSSLTDQQRYLVGYVNSVVGDVIKVSYSDGSTVDELFSVGSTPVLVYDENNSRNPFEIGSISDLDTYVNQGSGSKVIIQTYQMIQRVIMVYK